MAVKKQTNNNKRVTGNATQKNDSYVFQPFGAKSVALIYKYNLQSEENYKKLISSYERITSLPDSDPRKENLVDLWETEFNRIFEEFFESHAGKSKNKKSGVEGWKDRLDVREVSTSPDAKRKDLLGRLTPGVNSEGRKTKQEILERAGYQDKVETGTFNFTAEGKTGQNLREIESLLDVAEDMGLAEPTSFLSNGVEDNNEFIDGEERNENSLFKAISKNEVDTKFDENGYLIDDERIKAMPDPELASFVGSDVTNQEITAKTVENNEKNIVVSNEYISREQFNIQNRINSDPNGEGVVGSKSPFDQPDDAFVPFDLETGTFDVDKAKEIYNQRKQTGTIDSQYVRSTNIVYTQADELIDVDKRNIVSKEGFEIYKPENESTSISFIKNNESNEDLQKPYHEIKRVGNYDIKVDVDKRPTFKEILEENDREEQYMDELAQKLDYLRSIRKERRHRINMMKIERANSFIIARASKLKDIRERKRIKRREDLNLKAIEKADKLRRAQERQKIIELMKERQIKRSEEKRLATILRLERERRLEKDASYRSEVAAIDAQIRHEQELIKRTELRMKAYYAKNHEVDEFDDSLAISKKAIGFDKNLKKAEKVLALEEKNKEARIEKLSKKFNQNVK